MCGVKNNFLISIANIAIMLASFESFAMEPANRSDTLIYVKTSDSTIIIPRWKIDKMTTLSTELDTQKSENSDTNPLAASFITSEQLKLVSKALSKASLLGSEFEIFCNELARQDGLLELNPEGKRKIEYTFGNGTLRTLIDAAGKLKSDDISTLCLSFFVPSELQKTVIPSLITPVINYLNYNKCLEKRKILLEGHPSSVQSVAFSSSFAPLNFKNTLFSGSLGNKDSFIIWNTHTPTLKMELAVDTVNDIHSVTSTHDGKKIFLAGEGNPAYGLLKDFTNYGDLAQLNEHNFLGQNILATSAAFNSDGNKVVVGLKKNQNNLLIFDIGNLKKITTTPLQGHPASIQSVAWSNKYILSGCEGNQKNLILWQVYPNGVVPIMIPNNLNSINAVAISPNEKMIAFGGEGEKNNLFLCDISNLKVITPQPLTGHTRSVSSIAFSPDGNFLASGSIFRDKTLRLWNISNQKSITHTAPAGYSKATTSIAFSLDGKQMAIGCLGNNENLILMNFLSDTEKKELYNLTDIKQARLVNQLCLASQLSKDSKIIIDTARPEQAIFLKLPTDIQKLLINMLNLEIINLPHFAQGETTRKDITKLVNELENKLITEISSFVNSASITDRSKEIGSLNTLLKDSQSQIMSYLLSGSNKLNKNLTEEQNKLPSLSTRESLEQKNRIEMIQSNIYHINIKEAIALTLNSYHNICLKLEYDSQKEIISALKSFVTYFIELKNKLSNKAILDDYDRKIIQYIIEEPIFVALKNSTRLPNGKQIELEAAMQLQLEQAYKIITEILNPTLSAGNPQPPVAQPEKVILERTRAPYSNQPQPETSESKTVPLERKRSTYSSTPLTKESVADQSSQPTQSKPQPAAGNKFIATATAIAKSIWQGATTIFNIIVSGIGSLWNSLFRK